MRCLFWCHTEYIIRLSFAIPVHKMCEDSRDKGVQFVLEAAPQHQASDDAYFFILKASLDSICSKRVEEWKILIQDLIFLKLIEIREKKTHLSVLVSFKDLQDTKITIHLFVDIS